MADKAKPLTSPTPLPIIVSLSRSIVSYGWVGQLGGGWGVTQDVKSLTPAHRGFQHLKIDNVSSLLGLCPGVVLLTR